MHEKSRRSGNNSSIVAQKRLLDICADGTMVWDTTKDRKLLPGRKGTAFEVFFSMFLLIVLSFAGERGRAESGLRSRLLDVADLLLEEAQVSYVYGGSKLGDGQACERCNSCLATKSPEPKSRIKQCPACRDCSLDCSHFTELVFARAGAPYPYLATEGMRELSSATLRRRYNLLDLGRDVYAAGPGDLLVYDGHVVLLERIHARQDRDGVLRGDIIHATGGRDIKLPGQGIQRERYVEIAHMRGPVRRILRHVALESEGELPQTLRLPPAVLPVFQDAKPEIKAEPSMSERPNQLRRVPKRNPLDD